MSGQVGIEKDARIFVAGHAGLLGSALASRRRASPTSSRPPDCSSTCGIRRLSTTGSGPTGRFDTSKPDGMPRKVLDVSRLHDLGWSAVTRLREGVEATYAWFLAQHEDDLRLGAPAAAR